VLCGGSTAIRLKKGLTMVVLFAQQIKPVVGNGYMQDAGRICNDNDSSIDTTINKVPGLVNAESRH
jgi:hypothetical protein